MTSTLDSLSYTTLELEAIACDATREDLTLIIEELLEELGVLVVHKLNASLLKAAVLLLLYLSGEWSAIATSSCSCHGLLLCYRVTFQCATLLSIRMMELVLSDCDVAQDRLVTSHECLKGLDH